MKLFNKEFSHVSEAAIVLGFFTFFSQVLGIFRDRFLAGNIGAGSSLDVYYAAFRIPDLLFTFGVALLSISVLMPFLKKQIALSHDDGRKFINDIFTVFFFSMVVVSLLCFIFIPHLVSVIYPGFSSEELSQTIVLSRIMLLSPMLLGISNLFATITQAFKNFLYMR